MAASSTGSPSLWSALASGISDLELALARGGQGISLVGCLIAVHVALFVSRPTGLLLGAVTTLSLAYYSVARRLLRRGRAVGVLRFLSPTVEVGVPIVALVVLFFTEGPEYALGSWVPPQLWSVFLAASILRLDARVPVVMAAAASLSYGALWLVLFRPALHDTHLLLYRDDMQLVRTGSLLLTGFAASGAVVGLRRAIARASERLRAEDLFGKYRLGREIASGGMGKVLEATYCPEGGFQRRVAVKLVHPHLATDPEFVERFRKEAEIGAHLSHPNIVSTLDFGRVADTYFLAMEFVDGRPLSDLLAERRKAGSPLPAKWVAWIGHQIALGLDHAHHHAADDAGRPLRVVHRDLSPANVLVDRAGRVRITDFGVAKALGDTTRVHTKQLVGKPGYVAPEALDGSGVDTRSDLWSLGVVLWEAIANRRLFARESEAGALFAVVEGPIPRVADVRPEMDARWQALFDELLVRDRARRLPTAAAVRDRLAALVEREGAPTAEDLALLLATEEEADELPLDATDEHRPA